MSNDNSIIVVTNHEKVEADNFYLTDEWKDEDKDRIEHARELQKEGKLYYAYLVKSVDYALYQQMDSDEVFIDNNDDIVLYCESQIIDNDYTSKWLLEE